MANVGKYTSPMGGMGMEIQIENAKLKIWNQWATQNSPTFRGSQI